MELKGNIKNYEWGKIGSNSAVAQLQKSSNPEFIVDENLPYAELWMGTHIKGPSVIKNTEETLADLVTKHPEYLGEKVIKQFGELPFLLKVLSVDKALSIQAHPAKKHAEKLHAEFPDVYTDPNHKPEMAIALTPFEALCGFKPLAEIKQYISDIPELQSIVGPDVLGNDSELIQKAFRSVLTCDKAKIKICIDSLLRQFEETSDCQCKLVKRLHSQFPYDNGVLMVYFLNYLNLKPSEAIYLGANVPHAYLSGDCIECMACSDNVVRAGLTPKFVDVETLCSMLNYQGEKVEETVFSPMTEDTFSVIFRPPIPDFAVVQIKVPEVTCHFSTKERKSASILLVVSGKADYKNDIVLPGTILFIPAEEIVSFNNLQGELLLYQALANV